MTLTDDHRGALSQLAPQRVATYLANNGWSFTERIGRSALWVLTSDDEDYEVVLPPTRDTRDFTLRMVNLLEILITAERRPGGQILRDLTNIRNDRKYVHTFPRNTPGTISVSDGKDAVAGIKNLLIAGAYSVNGIPKMELPNSKSQEVRDFPRSALLGPASEGSYVFSIEIPSEAETHSATGQSFGRRALLNLYDMLNSAYHAAGQTRESWTVDPFAERVDEGVSWNLCRALSQLGGSQETPVEFRFSWALARPPDRPTPPIHFEANRVAAVSYAAQELKGGDLPHGRITLIGTVHRTQRISRDHPGWVVVSGRHEARSGEGRKLHAWLKLDPYHFNVALRAAERDTLVIAIGELSRTPRTELRNITHFDLAPPQLG